MRRLKKSVVWWCAGTVISCGEEAPPPLDTAAELWCDGLCTTTRRCGDRQTQVGCRSACADERPGLENISMRGAKLLGACLARFSCDETYNEPEWEAATDACWQNARRTVEPTAQVRRFCADYSQSWFECGSWLATDECESIFGMWADGVMDRVAVCAFRSTCDEFRACVETTFDTL